MDWKDCKDQGPWDFTERGDVFGYLNNSRWSGQQDAVDFCADHGLPLDLPDQHHPCGHWHKASPGTPELTPFDAGPWVAAMSRQDTPYIYLYDTGAKAVVKLDTSGSTVILAEALLLDPMYGLDYDMGQGNPGAQCGGYCMDSGGTRIWYLFRDDTGGCSSAELIEVDISEAEMTIVRKTQFAALMGSCDERINDACCDSEYTYWCTTLIAGRIIKIQNSDHSIVDDHCFNYPLVGTEYFDQGIVSIDIDGDDLYWIYCRDHFPTYNACEHVVRGSTSFVESYDCITCGTGFSTPGWQNMIRLFGGEVYHHRAYHPSKGLLAQKDRNSFTVFGSAEQQYLQNMWYSGGRLFTLMHVNDLEHPAYLYCFDAGDLSLTPTTKDVSYYAGQRYPDPYDWDWTSVSALNRQTDTIIIVRYHNIELKNYVACFKADEDFDLICDEQLDHIVSITGGNTEILSDEPQVWTMPA